MRNFRTFLSLLVLFLNLSCGDSYESSVDSTPPEEIGSISTEDPTAGVTRDSPEDSSLEDDTEYDQWIRSFRERMRADPYYALQNPKAFLSDPKLTSNMKKALTDEIFLMNVYMHTDEAFEFLSERIPESRWMNLVLDEILPDLEEHPELVKDIAAKWPEGEKPASDARDKLFRETTEALGGSDPVGTWNWIASNTEAASLPQWSAVNSLTSTLIEMEDKEDALSAFHDLLDAESLQGNPKALQTVEEGYLRVLMEHDINQAVAWVGNQDPESHGSEFLVGSLFDTYGKDNPGEAWALVPRLADPRHQRRAVNILTQTGVELYPDQLSHYIQSLPRELQQLANEQIKQERAEP